MKRLLSVLLVLCLALSLGGAALAESEPESTAPPAAITEEAAVTEPAETPAPAEPELPDDLRIIDWPPAPAAEPEGEGSEDEPGEEPEESADTEETVSEDADKPAYVYTGLLDPAESVGDIIVPNGLSWVADSSCVADRVEIEPGAVVDADHPVVILFSESDTVQDGEIRGNIRFIKDYDEVIAVVHTNDTHGYLNVEPFVKGLADQMKDSGAYSLVLTVNTGNVFTGGHAAAHVYNGEYIPYVMGGVYDFCTWGREDVTLPGGDQNAFFLSLLGRSQGMTTLAANRTALRHMDGVAYAAAYEPAVGAEEFIALYDDVLSWSDEGTIDYSALDLESYALEKGDNVLDDGALVETDRGTTVGVFGLSCYSGEDEGNTFISRESTVDAAQIMASALRAEGADVVVGIGSTGWWGEDSQETGDNDANSAQVAAGTHGIDAFIDGGTGSVINNGWGWMYENNGSMTMVNQAGCNGQAIGIMYLILKDGQVIGMCGENLTPGESGAFPGIVPDSEIRSRVARCYARLEADGYNATYASSEVFLNGEKSSAGNSGGGVLANETNLGDLVADGMLWIAKQRVSSEVSIALYPGAWIGTSLRAGYITLADAMAVFSRPMQMYYREITTGELVELLNDMCLNIGQDSDTMYQTAGLVCTYDPDTHEVASLAIDDILYYEDGVYMMDENHAIGCVTVAEGNAELAEEDVIASTNSELAELWGEYLQNGDFIIYPNTVAPAGRVTEQRPPEPEETAEGEESPAEDAGE